MKIDARLSTEKIDDGLGPSRYRVLWSKSLVVCAYRIARRCPVSRYHSTVQHCIYHGGRWERRFSTSRVHRYDACMGTRQVSRPPFLRRCNVKRAHLTCTTDVFYMYRSSVPPGVGFIPYVSYSSVSPRLGMTIYRGRMEATQETMQLPISEGDFSFLCLSLCRSWC